MDRCWEVTSMVYIDIVTFPRSIEVIRQRSMTLDDVICHSSGFCGPRGNLGSILVCEFGVMN